MDAKHNTIPLYNETRWSSSFKMLQRAIELKDCVQVWGLENKYEISEDDWTELQDLQLCLQVFNDLSVYLQGETYPTMWMCIASYNLLFDALDDMMEKYPNDRSLSFAFAKLKKYYELTNSCPANFISTILCTKYKLDYFIKNGFENEIRDIRST